jgi:uncharacterized peroxidase-related enzyme
VVHHGAGLRRITKDDALVERISRDPDGAELSVRERALVDYALKLTRTPWKVDESDLAPLRAADLDDRAILDLAMIVAYYAYVNRLADGLGVELEPDK